MTRTQMDLKTWELTLAGGKTIVHLYSPIHPNAFCSIQQKRKFFDSFHKCFFVLGKSIWVFIHGFIKIQPWGILGLTSHARGRMLKLLPKTMTLTRMSRYRPPPSLLAIITSGHNNASIQIYQPKDSPYPAINISWISGPAKVSSTRCSRGSTRIWS